MPKRIRSKEDVAKLKEIKQTLKDLFALKKETNLKVKSLKAERTAINAKYPKVQVNDNATMPNMQTAV